jgi:hypothetical protein
VSPDEQLDALAGAVDDLAGQFSLRPLLRRTLRWAVTLLGGGAGSISTVDERAGTYSKEADLGVGCQEGTVFSLREGATGAVVAARAPVLSDSYAEVRGGHVAAADRDRLHATIAVPIVWGGEIIGACLVFSTDPGVRFLDEDARLLGLFAKHAAIAIFNARLHAEAQERARRVAVSGEREPVVRDVHDTVARALGSILLHHQRAVPALPPRPPAARRARRLVTTLHIAGHRRRVDHPRPAGRRDHRAAGRPRLDPDPGVLSCLGPAALPSVESSAEFSAESSGESSAESSARSFAQSSAESSARSFALSSPQSSEMKTFLVSVKACGASGPSSRPSPDCLNPPNGVQ